MTCQFAIRLGAFAGHNAVADLLGLPTEPYRQETYVVCLDLGGAGAIFARGWEPQLELTRSEAKATKREINTVWIYPPAPDLTKLFAIPPAQVLDLSVPAQATHKATPPFEIHQLQHREKKHTIKTINIRH